MIFFALCLPVASSGRCDTNNLVVECTKNQLDNLNRIHSIAISIVVHTTFRQSDQTEESTQRMIWLPNLKKLEWRTGEEETENRTVAHSPIRPEQLFGGANGGAIWDCLTLSAESELATAVRTEEPGEISITEIYGIGRNRLFAKYTLRSKDRFYPSKIEYRVGSGPENAQLRETFSYAYEKVDGILIPRLILIRNYLPSGVLSYEKRIVVSEFLLNEPSLKKATSLTRLEDSELFGGATGND